MAAGDTILVHGASGAVGASVLQQAARIGARVIGTASPARHDAAPDGIAAASKAYRASVRAELVELAGAGDLVVPVARTFPLADAREAAGLLMGQHPGGKVVLEP